MTGTTQSVTQPGAARGRLVWASFAPALTAGATVGVVVVLIQVSFAALIFSGDLSTHLPAAVGVLLASSVLMLVAVAALSSVPVMVAVPQDTVAAVTALVAVSIAHQLPGPDRDTFLTVVAALAVTSLAAGVVLLLLGGLKLGNMVRFIPYPVVGGFLAGTGWLLVKGAIGVMAGIPVTLRNLSELFDPVTLARWTSGLVFAVVLFAALRRRPHLLVLPAIVVGSIGLSYVGLAAAGTSPEEARGGGWLLTGVPSRHLWRPLTASAISHADWSIVAHHLGSLLPLLFLIVVALLLNATGVELAIGRDVDLNRELRAAGWANIASGVSGGMAGYQALSLSVLGPKTGISSRLVAGSAAGVCAVAILVGPKFVTYIPTPVVGGLILFLGLGFLMEWVVDASTRFPRADYLVVLLILGVIGTFGFLQGVGAGMIAAIVLFVVNYSRTQFIKHELTGAIYRSKVERPADEREVLREHGDRVRILELQGFIFFGTANNLLEQIRGRVLDAGTRPLRSIVLDFRRVTGIDSSAILSFEKILQLAVSRGISLVLTEVAPPIQRQFDHLGLTEPRGVRFFADLDHGVEWCEDQLLARAVEGRSPPDVLPADLDTALPSTVDMDRLRGYLEPMQLEAGEPLVRQGEPAEDLFFIERGRVTVLLELPDGTSKRLRTMMPRTVVGEVALYLGAPRSSTVVAEERCTLYRLSRTSLERMERAEPALAASFHRFVARLTAERLVDATRALEDLLR